VCPRKWGKAKELRERAKQRITFFLLSSNIRSEKKGNKIA
jgi:hypothetical protein